jgi:hypothetical protein
MDLATTLAAVTTIAANSAIGEATKQLVADTYHQLKLVVQRHSQAPIDVTPIEIAQTIESKRLNDDADVLAAIARLRQAVETAHKSISSGDVNVQGDFKGVGHNHGTVTINFSDR